MYLYLALFRLNCPDLTICAILIIQRYIYSSIETARLCNRTAIHGDIPSKRIGGYRKCCHECSLGVYQVIDNFVYVNSKE